MGHKSHWKERNQACLIRVWEALVCSPGYIYLSFSQWKLWALWITVLLSLQSPCAPVINSSERQGCPLKSAAWERKQAQTEQLGKEDSGEPPTVAAELGLLLIRIWVPTEWCFLHSPLTCHGLYPVTQLAKWTQLILQKTIMPCLSHLFSGLARNGMR